MLRFKRIFVYAAIAISALLIPLSLAYLLPAQSNGVIEIGSEIDAPYLESSTHEYSLVYFGYVGCTKVCTPIMADMASFYDSDQFSPYRDKVGLVFVNLMPESSPEDPEIFSHSFHPSFEGVYLNNAELMRIDRDFALFFSKSLSNPGEIDHSDHIYLIKKDLQGSIRLISLYTTHPFHKNVIISDLQHLIKESE